MSGWRGRAAVFHGVGRKDSLERGHWARPKGGEGVVMRRPGETVKI